MFMDKPYVVMAQTLADSLLLHVSKEVVFSGLEHDPRSRGEMLAGLSRRLHGLSPTSRATRCSRAPSASSATCCGGRRPGGRQRAPYTVTLPTSKAIVASRLNLTPEHFSRILHDLSVAGLISVEGRDVVIQDVARLRSHTG